MESLQNTINEKDQYIKQLECKVNELETINGALLKIVTPMLTLDNVCIPQLTTNECTHNLPSSTTNDSNTVNYDFGSLDNSNLVSGVSPCNFEAITCVSTNWITSEMVLFLNMLGFLTSTVSHFLTTTTTTVITNPRNFQQVITWKESIHLHCPCYRLDSPIIKWY